MNVRAQRPRRAILSVDRDLAAHYYRFSAMPCEASFAVLKIAILVLLSSSIGRASGC
jgi:hypothetical protein